MLIKFSLVVLACNLSAVSAFAQHAPDIHFGKIAASDFEIAASPAIDSNAKAVVIADIGETHFEGNARGWFSHVFKKTTRFKVLNRAALSMATIQIPLYVKDQREEVLSDISASSYRLEGGKVVETKLEKANIYKETEDVNHSRVRFVIPGAQEGSVVEYTYTIKSDFDFNMPSWSFQSMECPTLWSEYTASIPSTLVYLSSTTGYHNFVVNTTDHKSQSYELRQTGTTLGQTEKMFYVNAITYKRHWAMKDLPALKMEAYMSSPQNCLDKIEFQLYQTYDGEKTNDVYSTWAKASEQLLLEKDFGETLSWEMVWAKDALDKAVTPGADRLIQAKQVYYYVQKNFTCTNHNDPHIKTTLEEVFRRKSGTVGEINLLLVALLRSKGFIADPVLLSTRSNGRTSEKFPVLAQLNYVICRVMTAGETFYLDASRPYLGYGKLEEECYNGYAHVISKDTSFVPLQADSLLEMKTTTVSISNTDNRLSGLFESQLGDNESLRLRGLLASGHKDDLLKSIADGTRSENIAISHLAIDSIDNPEVPLNLRFDVQLNMFGDNDLVYFNPVLYDGVRQNPFHAASREYPVELSSARQDTYILTMDIPKGYTVDELPKSARIRLNEHDGLFEYMVEKHADDIQLRCSLSINKTFFAPEEYQSLRDFYGHVVRKESESIVFRKIK